MRKPRIAIASVAVLFMVGAFPALASASAHHPVLAGVPSKVPNITSGDNLCAALNTHLCLHGNGTYNQMTIETSDLSDITFTPVPHWPTGTYTLTNAGGNCIRENDSNRVNVEASGCSITDLDEIWTLYQGGTAATTSTTRARTTSWLSKALPPETTSGAATIPTTGTGSSARAAGANHKPRRSTAKPRSTG